MPDACTIEVCLDGEWRLIASLDVRGDPLRGHAGTPTHLCDERCRYVVEQLAK